MHWIITDADLWGGEQSRIGRGYLAFSNAGPDRGSSVQQRRQWVANYLLGAGVNMPYEWRTKDDDGGVVYMGRCGDIADCEADLAFVASRFRIVQRRRPAA